MNKSTVWFYCLFVALLHTLAWGYMFNSGDQAEHLPQVYHLQDRLLYKSDFFIQEYSKIFTIRDYYVFVVYKLSYLMPVAWVCFIFQLLAITFSAVGIFRVTQVLTDNKLAPFLSPIFVLIIFRDFTLGGNSVQDAQFLTSSFAWSLGMWAFYKLLSKNYIAAGAFAGLAALCQPLIGMQAMVVIFLVMLWQNKHIAFSRIIYTPLAFWACSVLMLFPLFIRQFFTPFTGDENLYLTLLYEFRNFDHYIPHLFPKTDYLRFGFILVLGVFLLFKLKLKEASTLKAFFVIIIAGLLFYTYAVETHTMCGIGKLQWFKTTVWLTVFSSIFVTIKVAGWIEKPLIRPTMLKIYRWVVPVLSLGFLFIILNSAILPALGDKYQIGNYTKSDLTKLHEWVEKNTDINAVFLVPPADHTFACEAKRSQAISFKAIIHEPAFMLKWYERVKEVYGTTIESVKGKKAMNEANSLYKERNYKEHITMALPINYRIDNVKYCQYVKNLGPIVHQEGDWIVTQF